MRDSRDPVEEAARLVLTGLKCQGDPFQTLYHKPKGMSMVYWAKWVQRYITHKVYMTIFEAAKVTGYLAVPARILSQETRQKYRGRRLRTRNLCFYLLRPEEMSRYDVGLYREFAKALAEDNFEVTCPF